MTLLNPQVLQDLIAEYARLQRLDGFTPQSRGHRLNGFIAEMLGCWGIGARSDTNTLGNIDVVFEAAGFRFILEAKWENHPADTGHVTKLQKRVRQRLQGTIGVMLAVSGYSEEALHDVKDGERLEVLLISREHLDAMLVGLVPPEEMFSMLLQHASFFGDPSPSLFTLLAPDGPVPPIRFGPPPELPVLVRSASATFEAEVVLSDLPFGQHGVSEIRPGVLVLTLTTGLIEVDLSTTTVTRRLLGGGCSRNTLPHDLGTSFVRRHGVGVVDGDRVFPVAGGWGGNVALFQGPDDAVWALSGIPDNRGQSAAAVFRIGTEVGEQVLTTVPNLFGETVPYPLGSATNVGWAGGDDYGPYASEWGERVRIRGGRGLLGQVTPPAWRSTRSR